MIEYAPQPIDTSMVELTPAQLELIKHLARNAHEVWARKRMADGWRYGPSRNDAEKTHPCLVEYEKLPESEKDYDRVMVEEAIRSAVALGYRIEKI